MVSRLGSIVLEKKEGNPIVIISEENRYLMGLKLVKSESLCIDDDEFSHFKVMDKELVKIGYRGKKLDSPIVDCGECVSISNLQLREIGKFTEDGYYKLLRRYTSYHASIGAECTSYLMVRNEVHKQLIKSLNIHGV